jgi:L-aminopeptidase/D-esterase-like protein
MALGVDGVRIGTWTAPGGTSGCTVVLPPPGTVGAIAVRGTAPGTREAAALAAGGKVMVCHGVVLAGGSAYGLAAADGVMRHLEAAGVGYPVATAIVPIVGAAIVLDAAVADPASRPGARLPPRRTRPRARSGSVRAAPSPRWRGSRTRGAAGRGSPSGVPAA